MVALFAALPGMARAANDPPVPIRIRYSAPSTCPSERDFVARLQRRYPIFLGAPNGGDVVELHVSVREAGDGASGEVRIVRGSAASVRTVTGDSCDETVTALALVTAVVLDAPDLPDAEPMAALTPEPTHSEPSRASPAPPASGDVPVPQPDHRYSLQIGAGLGLRTAVLPGTSVGSQAQIRVALLQPVVRAMLATFSSHTGGSLATQAGTADFLFMAGELRGCPVMWSRGPVEAGPCATIELGRLRGSGDRTEKGTVQAGTWLAPGALADWRITLGPLVLAMAGGLGFPLIRDRFYFELREGSAIQRIPVHQAPYVDLRAEVTLGFSTSQ